MDSFEYERINQQYQASINNSLAKLLQAGNSIYPRLAEAMEYSLLSGGKRIRPCLTLAVCDMFRGDLERAMPLACGVEMIHTYSLIHDDLPCMDDDAMRRGKPSNHIMFGEATAILAGDALLSYAFEIMLEAALLFSDSNYYKAVSCIAKLSGAGGMVSGQAADIFSMEEAEKRLDRLLYIHRHKTADMLTASVLSGAYAAHADENCISALQSYSAYIGLLFQITDDILDSADEAIESDSNSKLTYVSLFGVDGARQAAIQAAAEARKAIVHLPNSDYLEHTIESILSRSC